jgi:hypothetical protein
VTAIVSDEGRLRPAGFLARRWRQFRAPKSRDGPICSAKGASAHVRRPRIRPLRAWVRAPTSARPRRAHRGSDCSPRALRVHGGIASQTRQVRPPRDALNGTAIPWNVLSPAAVGALPDSARRAPTALSVSRPN